MSHLRYKSKRKKDFSRSQVCFKKLERNIDGVLWEKITNVLVENFQSVRRNQGGFLNSRRD